MGEPERCIIFIQKVAWAFCDPFNIFFMLSIGFLDQQYRVQQKLFVCLQKLPCFAGTVYNIYIILYSLKNLIFC
jgi:hypothetical protein